MFRSAISNNSKISFLRVQNNIGLSCIKVDNNTFSNIPSDWKKDSTAIYSLNCVKTKTYVPDDNFEKALISYGYDDVLDDFVLTENITEIKIATNDIIFVKLIEHCRPLRLLNHLFESFLP